MLYEVANESSGDPTNPEVGDSTEWQYWVIEFVKEYERQRGYDQHPVGMTMQFPVADQRKVNDPLFDGPADWISPGFDDSLFDPASEGAPAPGRWFTDPPPSDGTKVLISDTDHLAPGRGDALAFAERMRLIEMEPRGDVSSTGYALASPGMEYLVLEPSGTAVVYLKAAGS